MLTVLYSEAWARGGLHLPRVGHFHDDTPEGQFDNVRANALQIAHYKVGGWVKWMGGWVGGVGR